MHITFVKKIKADGEPCRKCGEVEGRLRDAQLFDRLDAVAIADERDPQSEGMQLATQYNVDQAPFFLVKDDAGKVQIYTSYFRFIKEVMNASGSEQEEIAEIMQQDDSLDFL